MEIDNLVQRQAAIVGELEDLDWEDAEPFLDLPLLGEVVSSRESKARRLLRGLVRNRVIGRTNGLIGAQTDGPAIIPALPDFFQINLMPLLDGGFDRQQVLKTPVVAWALDSQGYAAPVKAGLPIGYRWVVLTPGGLVIADEITSLFDKFPVPSKTG